MPIDASIALGVKPPEIESPLNSLAKVLGIQQAQQANQINGMKMDSYRRDQERQNKLYSVLGSLPQGATDEDRINALSSSGFLNEADGVRQGVAKLQDTKSQAREREAKANREDFQSKLERANYIGSAMASVLRTPTVESAHATIDALASNRMLSPEQAAQYKEQVAQNPAGIAQMAEAQYRAALGAKEQALKEVTQDTGGVTNTLAFDPAVGKTAVVNSVKNTQSPNNIATVGASYANAAATRDMAQSNRDAANIQAGFKNEQSVREEFNGLPEIKNYKQAFPAYKAIKDAAGRNTPQSDINLVYGIAKLYDPTSVVREGEYSTVANSPNIPERVKGYAQYLAGGGKLSPETKKQIVAEAESRIGTYKAEHDKARSTYNDIVKQRGMNPNTVLPAMGDASSGAGGAVDFGSLK
jgi:hypothetical protein